MRGRPPAPFGPEGLVIAWTGPVPSQARISLTSHDVFELVDRAIGPPAIDVPRQQHGTDVYSSEVFNVSMAWDLDEVRRWNDRHGFVISDEALALFSKYLETGKYAIFQSLVQHPAPPEEVQKFEACSVVFQRGEIFYDPDSGRQDLFLRSQFHDTGPGGAAVNFTTTSALHLSFQTNPGIWYPLQVTKLNREPTSVVLDICTPNPLKQTEFPKGFNVDKKGRVRYGVHDYHVCRLIATFGGEEEVPDFQLTLR
jgi:hypothetical protein